MQLLVQYVQYGDERTKRLTNLTSVSAATADKKLDELYPKHAAALNQPGLGPKEYPTLGRGGKDFRGGANVFFANRVVVKNTSIPESTLTKKHNAVNYHTV